MEAAGCVSESLWRETLLKKDSPSKLSQHSRQLELQCQLHLDMRNAVFQKFF